jgi:hypothetical protein
VPEHTLSLFVLRRACSQLRVAVLCVRFLSCRAAFAEFKLGCAERGRSVFEGVLVNYPKRTDLWNVYLDQVCVCVMVCV